MGSRLNHRDAIGVQVKKQRGYAIPLSLCVAGVTLFLGLSAAQMTAGDLNVANHLYHQERARQMADYGLERCVVQPVASGTELKWQSLSKAHPYDSVRVTVFGPSTPGCPVVVPAGYEYWVSEGSVGTGSRTLATAKIGALVRYGQPAGTAGAQIRYMTVHAEDDDRVLFKVLDSTTGQEVPNETICSTEAREMPTATPPVAPLLTTPVTLSMVSEFRGKVKIPQGASNSIVSYDIPAGKNVAITQDGGPLNVPQYSPPSGLTPISELTVDDARDLSPGEYGILRLTPRARVTLNGTYHIGKLILTGGNDSEASRLTAGTTRASKFFVDQIEQNSAQLEIQNQRHKAGDFRITFQKVAPQTAAPLVVKMVEGGEAAIIAQGRAVKLTTDDHRGVQGSFSCEVLTVHYPEGSVTPEFVYDISATTARRPRGISNNAGGIGANDDNEIIDPGGTGHGNSDAETATADNGNSGNSGNSGGYSTSGTNPGPKPKQPGAPRNRNLNEPMVLSRQAL